MNTYNNHLDSKNKLDELYQSVRNSLENDNHSTLGKEQNETRANYLRQIPTIVSGYEKIHSDLTNVKNELDILRNSLEENSKNLEEIDGIYNSELSSYIPNRDSATMEKDNLERKLNNGDITETHYNNLRGRVYEKLDKAENIVNAQTENQNYCKQILNDFTNSYHREGELVVGGYFGQIERLDRQINDELEIIQDTINKYNSFIGV